MENTSMPTGLSERMGECHAGGRAACCGGRRARAAHSWRPVQKCAGVSRSRTLAWSGVALLLVVAAGRAQADLTAAYDGSLKVSHKTAAATIAGALQQTNVALSGTLAVADDDATVSGVYWVNGQMHGAKLVLSGTNSAGVRLKWKGKKTGDAVLRGMAHLTAPGKRMKGMLELVRRHPAPPVSPPQSCDNSFFTAQVMGQVLGPICANCHVPGGAAAAANFRVTIGDLLATQTSVDLQIDPNNPLESRILTKPLNTIPHGGGQQLSPGSDTEKVLEQWVNLVATGHQCDAGSNVPTVALTPAQLLLRASMDLRGTRPALAELDAIEADPNTYPSMVDAYLHSPAFLERVKDAYDDALLVRREDFRDESRDETSAIYGEALELISYIVDNDRPFTEIGTADFTVANQLFQRDTVRLPYAMEPVVGDTWQPTHYTDGRPHAGLLSTSAFYDVWDTNDTNKNRRRANRWSIVFHCYNFLDTPVDVTRNVDNNDADAVLNAVTTRSDCKACHDRLDPMASFLFPLDDAAQLEGGDGTRFFSGDPERWRSANKRPPAVYGTPGTDIRDMGRLLVAHPKFAECQTKRAFKMLFLRNPQTTPELTAAADLASRWGTEDNYNLRALVRRWMLSDVYRNRPETDGGAWVRRVSPERFESLIADLTGFTWTRPPEDDEDDADPNSDPPRTDPVPLLTNEEEGFKIILGGINGTNVSGRSYSMNASVAIVQRKVASLAAEYVVRTDLAAPDASRRLLAGVTGMEDPAVDDAALRAHIVTLARRLYGEHLAPDSPQVDGWFGLYRALFTDTTQSGTGYDLVPGTAGERAWRGLLVAMLRSDKILLY